MKNDRERRRAGAASLPVFGAAQRREMMGSAYPMRIFRHDTLRFVDVNDAALALYGYTRAEFLRLTVRDTRHPDEHADLMSTLARPTGYLRHWGMRRHLRKSGEILFVEIVHQDVAYQGRPCRVAIILDVTERENALRRLRESEQRFELAVAATGLGMWDWDLRTGLVWRHPRWARMLGYAPRDVRGAIGAWRDYCHPQDWSGVQQRLHEYLQGRAQDYVSEYRMRRADGDYLWVLCRGNVVERDACGRPLRMIGYIRDISARKQAEERRLASVLRQRDALVREIHHRVKNHLQGVVGLLREKTADNPMAALAIEDAVAQLQSVAAVYGLQAEAAGDVPLRQVLEAVCASVARASGAAIERRFDAAAAALWLAEREAVPIAVVLHELLFNALKHGRARPGEPPARLALREAGDAAEIRILNRGGWSDRRAPPGDGRGTGLELVRALLPPAGSELAFVERDGREVEVTLRLCKPLLVAREAEART
jgi:PAS domain S-box-containing protein